MKKGKAKFHLCRDYLGFGIVSVLVGAAFLILTMATGATPVKVAVTAFFLALGAIDLALYRVYGGKTR